MWKYALLALSASLLISGATGASAGEPVRKERNVKQDCMSEDEIIALLKERGFHPVKKPNRDGDIWGVLTERRGTPEESESGTGEPGQKTDRTGAYVVIDGCTGEIVQVNKALLPEKE